MKIYKLVSNNIKEISCNIKDDISIGIGGLSGSGKSSFCSAISNESIKRIVTLLPKSEYRFLFSDKLISNYSAQNISEIPLIFYLGKSNFSSNPRSTLGTHTGIYKEIRDFYATIHKKTSEFFSFNNSIMWCPTCKGRGSTSGHLCKTCGGTRYSKKINEYTLQINGKNLNIYNVNELSIEEIYNISDKLGISNTKKNILKNIIDLDIGYLSLNRIMNTLSGGEGVRVLLSEFMAQCINSLIIIDEVSIGLDTNSLINVLEKIKKLGVTNQIWLIDHSDIVLNATDSNIFFGPGSGKNGGKIVSKSPRPKPEYRTINKNKPREFYTFKNMKKRILNIPEINIPKNRITTITGESGCGKSTLVNDCMIPYLKKMYTNIDCEIIGQDRNQSITSKSTIATFLDLKKTLNKYDDSILEMSLIDAKTFISKNTDLLKKLNMLIDLGLGYLTFNRKIQTLSTGEFQCVHLISKLTQNKNNEMILFFDEPSKGLSQNILNLLIKTMNTILKDPLKTIIIIEHNSYILKCSDYIIDFGKRTSSIVNNLPLYLGSIWNQKINYSNYNVKIHSHLNTHLLKGIKLIDTDVDHIFTNYENHFKGGLLKNLSSTAQWIYNDYKSDIIEPIISLDLEKTLYSKNSFVYEIAGLINHIIENSHTIDINSFDFYSKNNLCECCKGTGKNQTINFDLVIKDSSKGLWDGLLKDEIMSALKKYNYTKIKFLFKEIKNETKIDLSKPYNKMNTDEKTIFLYGYWKKSFYDKDKKTQRKWQGIIHLINKYMRSSKTILKQLINESKQTIVCPICHGSILKHDKKLEINGKDIREYITSSIGNAIKYLPKEELLKSLSKLIGKDIFLNSDVSILPIEKQVQLKIFELMSNNYKGYTIVLKNTQPFIKDIQSMIDIISKNNKVLLLNYKGITETKHVILEKYFTKSKIKPSSYVYEIIGYKKIISEINKIRKIYPCEFCNGKKVLKEDSIFDGVDVTETPCHACNETGINPDGLNLKIAGFNVSTWLNGTLKNLDISINEKISTLSPIQKINELNKKQLYDIINYLKGC